MTEDEKRAFALSTIPRMAEATLRYLTQVIGVEDARTGEFRGTGFFCEVEGRQAVVTAEHVLREAERTGRFQSMAFSLGDGEKPRIAAGKILCSDELDLAVYLPDDAFPLGPRKAFRPEDRIDRDPDILNRDYLFLHGFPGRDSRWTAFGPGIVSESLAYGAMACLRRANAPFPVWADSSPPDPSERFVPDDLLKSHQFAINFDPKGVVPIEQQGNAGTSSGYDLSGLIADGPAPPGQKPLEPFGLSGSPVWRIGGAGRAVRDWNPSWSQLVGVVTHWDQKEGVHIASHASLIRDIVREHVHRA